MSEQQEQQRTVRHPNRNFVTLPEVAAAKGVSRVAVLYAIRAGRLRASRSPGRREWMIHVDDARAYLEVPVRRVAAAS
jgi:hypothetical protein